MPRSQVKRESNGFVLAASHGRSLMRKRAGSFVCASQKPPTPDQAVFRTCRLSAKRRQYSQVLVGKKEPGKSLQNSTAARSVMLFKTVLGDSPVLVSSPGSTCSSSIPQKATRIAFPGNGGQSVEHDRGCASFRPIPYRAASRGYIELGHGS